MKKRKIATIVSALAVVGLGSLVPAAAAPQPATHAAATQAAQIPNYTPADLAGKGAFAPAAAAKAAALTPGQCTGSWIYLTSNDKITFRTSPDATVNNGMFTLTGFSGYVMPCRKLVVGGGYAACGKSGANGWILVQDYQNWGQHEFLGWSAYVPSVCVSDYS